MSRDLGTAVERLVSSMQDRISVVPSSRSNTEQ
jgi:hypothetical protein